MIYKKDANFPYPLLTNTSNSYDGCNFILDIELNENTYDYIIPAYHMNKEHWNTIIIDEKVDEYLVKELIEQSYQLTK